MLHRPNPRGHRAQVVAYAVALIAVFAVISGADLTSTMSGQEATAPFADVDTYIEEEMDGSRIPGVALAIVEGGQVVHARGFGSDGHGGDVTPQTPFWIGSNTKSFTALAVMQLAEAGLIDLDAPVQRYLPDFTVADAEAAAQVTVRHLLNQTSGFSRADGIAIVAAAEEQTLQEAVDGFADLEFNRPVGESFEYSNPNFVVLGLLIEQVTGMSWGDYIQANIFDPLGMVDSYSTLEAAVAGGLTATHRYWFGFPVATEGTYIEGLAPTGYLYSSAEDLARYLITYLQSGQIDGARILSESGITEMLTGAANTRSFELQSRPFEARYGAGWFDGPFGVADDARWHGGTLPHFISWIVLLPETDQAVVVLVNASSQMPFAGANEVFARLPVGVVNLLRAEEPPTGLGLSRFYLIFDAVVLGVVAIQAWSMYLVARRRLTWPRGGLRSAFSFVPLVWEVGLSLAMSGVLATSWGANSQSIPDLMWTLVVVALLWLVTGVIRIARLFAARRGTQGTSPQDASDERGAPSRPSAGASSGGLGR